MRFPNAQKGIKKLFTAEILSLINVIGSVATLIIGALLERVGEGENVGSVALLIAMLTIIASSMVLVIVALILNIVGVIQAAKDESSFKVVIYVSIFGLLIAIMSGIFSIAAGAENQALSNISQMVNDIVNTVTTALIVMGICNLANLLNDMTIFHKGQVLLRIIVVIALASLFTKAITSFIPNSATVVIEIALTLVTGILTIIQYFAYLSFLGKSSKMLSEATG